MNYIVESARAIGKILGIVVGAGYTSPADETAKEYPCLPFYG